jgi:uncharacterized coiled-coil protein SlyX
MRVERTDTGYLEMRIHESNDKIDRLKYQLRELQKTVDRLNEKVDALTNETK